jgi:hypothetical protein
LNENDVRACTGVVSTQTKAVTATTPPMILRIDFMFYLHSSALTYPMQMYSTGGKWQIGQACRHFQSTF